jgi:sodium/hydrogen antiporter
MEALPRPQSPPTNQAEHLAAVIQPVVAFMVLCSILIHGLSIPFFSLGRRVTTVTRTWSRPQTQSLPDWALHTRRVERAEDVVINHDPANIVERGQTGEGEKGGVKGNLSETEGPGYEKCDCVGQREDSTDAPTLAVTELDEGKEGNVPDHAEIVLEWKEGPHRIIERRTGPSEEVRLRLFPISS